MELRIRDAGAYRAALYIRLSKEDDRDGPSQSVTNQKAMLEAFARREGITVHDIYTDDGWSGTRFDRPDFLRMLRDIEAGKVNMVITKDLSRLGRDYIQTGHYMERYFPEKRVRYISLLDGIDTGVESTANDITPFRAIMNDMYAKDISRKIRSVKREKQRRGQFIGGRACYGYKMHPAEKNRIAVDEEAAAVVRQIFSWALEGMSCRAIAGRLNEEGVPSPSVYGGRKTGCPGPYAGLWSSERISEMLRNEMYIGNMVQGRMVKLSYKSQKCLRQPRESWVVVENTHQPLVSEEVFRKVGWLLESRRHTRSRTYDFPLKGLIFCHECGYPLGVLNRKTGAGKDRLIFVCRTYQRFTKAGVCTCHCVKEETVMRAVTEEVARLRENCVSVEELKEIALQTLDAETGQPREEELRDLRGRLEQITEHLDKMYLDKLTGILSEGDFLRIYDRLREERERLLRQCAQLEQPPETARSREERADELVDGFLREMGGNRELLAGLISRAELTEDKKLYIRFRCKAPADSVGSAGLRQEKRLQ